MNSITNISFIIWVAICSHESNIPLSCRDQIKCSVQSCLCIGTSPGASVSVLSSSLLLHTSPLQVPPSHPSCTCRVFSFHKSSKYFFLFSIFFLSWSQKSSNSLTSSSSLSSWIISLIPPSPRHSFRKCLSVSSAPDSHTGQFTIPPWNLWRQFNLRVLVLHLNRVTEPTSFEYIPYSLILFFALYISRVYLSFTSVLHLLSSHSFTLSFFFAFLSVLHDSLQMHAYTAPLASSIHHSPPAPSSPIQLSAVYFL